MINWIDSWYPGCWCFDRRPVYAAQRQGGKYNYEHGWVWFLWEPRDEAKPHVVPTAWGFENGLIEPNIIDLVGTDRVYALQSDEADWSYLCDVLFACDDMTPQVRAEIKQLSEAARRENLQRLANSFESVDSEDFTMFMECCLQNTVPEDKPDPAKFFMYRDMLIRQRDNLGRIERYDKSMGAFLPFDAQRFDDNQATPLTHRAAAEWIRNANKNRKLST